MRGEGSTNIRLNHAMKSNRDTSQFIINWFRTFNLSIIFLHRKFYASRVQKTVALPIPGDPTVSDVSSEEDDDESAYLPVDDIDDDEYTYDDSEEENNDAIESETDEELVEDEDDEDDDNRAATAATAPITWARNRITWTSPGGSQIAKEKIHLKAEYASKCDYSIEPYELIKTLYFTPDFFKWIHDQTLLYNTWRQMSAQKRNRRIVNPTLDEIKIAIGIVLYMGIVKLPNRRWYWQAKTRVDTIANAMPYNRFCDITSMMHYNDNTGIPANGSTLFNRAYKVQPLINFFRLRFSQVVNKETFLSIDEQMVPFKGKHSLKRYVKNKPKKWGYKMWALAGISGYIYDFQLDGGLGVSGAPISWTDAPKACGESGNVVLRLVEHLPPDKHKVFFDNYFNSPELLKYLESKGIWALGTLRSDRSRGCPLMRDKEMKKEGRGFCEEHVSNDKSVVITSWYDNKRVLVMSNFLGKAPITQCRRFDKKNKEYMLIDRPAAITVYNKFMGGVDKADMLLSLYRTKCRTRKWYQRIAHHLWSLCAVNAWIIHREMSVVGHTYVNFLYKLAVDMISSHDHQPNSEEEDFEETQSSKKRVRSLDVPMTMRYDKYDHWPHLCDLPNSQRCKMEGCKRKTQIQMH